MKKYRCLKIILSSSFVLSPLSIAPLCSCSVSSVKSLDGSDWKGIIGGNFIEDDYEINYKTKTVTYVSAISIHSYNLVIPNYVKVGDEHFKVLLGAKCFKHNEGISSSVELNDFIFSIPDECFFGCSSLTTLIFHQQPLSFGILSVAACPIFSKILIYANNKLSEDWASQVVSIGDFAFYTSSNLCQNLMFGSSLSYVGTYAFYGCAMLPIVSFEFSRQITAIPDACFMGSGLQQIYFPETLKVVGESSFAGCISLTDVILPTFNMSLELKDKSFFNCSSLTSFSKDVTFTKIGSECFSESPNWQLRLWEPRYNLKEIPDEAFTNCGLNSVKFYANGPVNVGNYAFADNPNLSVIDFSDFHPKPYPDPDEPNPFNVPQWTGQHIFSGSCSKGGKIILDQRNVFSQEWKDFIENNGIKLGRDPAREPDSWYIVSDHIPDIFITEPTKLSYTVPYVSESETTLVLDSFTYSCDEEIDPSLLYVSFNPVYVEDIGDKKIKHYFADPHDGNHVEVKINEQSHLITLTLKAKYEEPDQLICGKPYLGRVSFFYGTQKINTTQNEFQITINKI